MEGRRVPSRVSEAQWGILMEFLESHPNLARARGYNNSARGRAEALRLWQEVANLLNAEGSGTTKSAKEWSVYISNYKSKLKKIVADINIDAHATGGGPPRAINLTDTDTRFLALLGPGFGQTAPQVRVQPFPDEGLPRKTLRVGDLSFEQEVSELLLASDQSDNEENIEDFFVLESELIQNHESDNDEDRDQDEDQDLGEKSGSDSSDNIPISELVRTNYYYGKNRYKWAKTPPSSRVRTPQHNIITSRAGSSKLTPEDELVDELSSRKLTYVGMLKKNKREIPIEFLPKKDREVNSTLFGFTSTKTLCSYVPKKNRAVMLVSSMHHSDQIDEKTNKPEIIMYYNLTKGGVDEADKNARFTPVAVAQGDGLW
ncbi:hypothetical protein PYW07_009184 [Mythimna separata]|uniref:PiggyBac transposable element-derived protein domain-containing protein n=1 Tax=Mythimna separata TaxID=271217 RepID=A0AAD8DM49_MYTSE|nr:hypothetical protein PYW07_009184 [Mythimna separata]